MTTIIRTATIRHSDESRQPKLETVQAYLPSNYQAVQQGDNSIFIVGVDSAGWTMHSYVLPRLASGLISAVEGWYLEVPDATVTIKHGEVQGVTLNIEGAEVRLPATVRDESTMLLDVIDETIVDVPTVYTV